MIESGTFASVSKALDSLVTVDGQISEAAGAPRLLSAEHMALLQVIAKDSPDWPEVVDLPNYLPFND